MINNMSREKYLFNCCLSYDSVHISWYIASNFRIDINNKLEVIFNGVVVTYVRAPNRY